MNVRHLLEKHKLSRQLFKEVNQWLSSAEIYLKEGTIVDATITETENLLHGEETFISANSGYRGLAKNDNKLSMLFALANVFRIDQVILAARG